MPVALQCGCIGRQSLIIPELKVELLPSNTLYGESDVVTDNAKLTSQVSNSASTHLARYDSL